jgi:uncharacterized membrane protein
VLLIILDFCVVCFVFVCGGSVLLIILVFCVVCFLFVCGGSVLLVILAFCVETKHTTQKTKMIGNTDPHKQKQTTQHRKLK